MRNYDGEFELTSGFLTVEEAADCALLHIDKLVAMANNGEFPAPVVVEIPGCKMYGFSEYDVDVWCSNNIYL